MELVALLLVPEGAAGYFIDKAGLKGLKIGDALDLRVGVRSTTSFSATDDKSNKLGTVSWMDGILVLGVSL